MTSFNMSSNKVEWSNNSSSAHVSQAKPICYDNIEHTMFIKHRYWSYIIDGYLHLQRFQVGQLSQNTVCNKDKTLRRMVWIKCNSENTRAEPLYPGQLSQVQHKPLPPLPNKQKNNFEVWTHVERYQIIILSNLLNKVTIFLLELLEYMLHNTRMIHLALGNKCNLLLNEATNVR